MKRAILVLVAILIFASPASSSDFDDDGYRINHYRAPVPDTLSGSTVVDNETAFRLWQEGQTIFVDVFPRPPRPKLPEGTIFRQPPRFGIPDSIWLPNVGYGKLADVTLDYLRHHLDAQSEGDKDHQVLFFCLMDCWMSWNAAKRATEELGYSRVFWYPEGTDGWAFMDFPLEQITPAE